MMSLLFPLCTFFLLCLCIAYWASTAVYPFLFLFFLFPPGEGRSSEIQGLPGRSTSRRISGASGCRTAGFGFLSLA